MSLLYLVLLTVCAFVGLLLRVRARSLERQYTNVAKQTDDALKAATLRPGNASKPDPFQEAKRQFELGRLAQKRDDVEARYTGWRSAADRVGRFTARLRGWQGKYLPYLLGAADAVLLLVVLDQFGAEPGSGSRLVMQTVSDLLHR